MDGGATVDRNSFVSGFLIDRIRLDSARARFGLLMVFRIDRDPKKIGNGGLLHKELRRAYDLLGATDITHVWVKGLYLCYLGKRKGRGIPILEWAKRCGLALRAGTNSGAVHDASGRWETTCNTQGDPPPEILARYMPRVPFEGLTSPHNSPAC